MVESFVSPGESYVYRIVPSGLIELSFYLGRKPETVANNRKSISDSLLVSGQQIEFYDVLISQPLNLFSITFQPQGAMQFFDLPLIELLDQNIPLRYLHKEAFDKLDDDLFSAKSFARKVQVAERFLIRLLSKKEKEYNRPRINESIRLINQSRGDIAIGKLARNACLSRKQFERLFRNLIGIPPKQFLKVVRFQNAIFQKQQNQAISLTNVAYDCGYYDQSHMIHDFKQSGGTIPSNFF